jgi:hypothetical protein
MILTVTNPPYYQEAKMAAKRKKKAAETSSVVDKSRLDNFEKRDEKTPGGRFAYDVGDQVADMLRGKDQAGLKAIAVKHGFDDSFRDWVKKDLNFGMIRMNTGNKVRAILRAKAEGKAATAKPKAKAKAKKAAKPRLVGGTATAA